MSTLALGRQRSIIFLLGLFTNVALRYEFYMVSIQNDFQISVQKIDMKKTQMYRRYKFERNITLIHEVKLWADVVNANLCRTRMHSNRMRSAHSLPNQGERVSVQGGLCPGGGSLSRDVNETPPEGTWDHRQRPPWKEHRTKDRRWDPPWKEHGSRDRDYPRRNMGPGSQRGSDIIQTPPPRGQNNRRK